MQGSASTGCLWPAGHQGLRRARAAWQGLVQAQVHGVPPCCSARATRTARRLHAGGAMHHRGSRMAWGPCRTPKTPQNPQRQCLAPLGPGRALEGASTARGWASAQVPGTPQTVRACKAAKVVDAGLVVDLERPAQALDPPLEALLPVRLQPRAQPHSAVTAAAAQAWHPPSTWQVCMHAFADAFARVAMLPRLAQGLPGCITCQLYTGLPQSCPVSEKASAGPPTVSRRRSQTASARLPVVQGAAPELARL